MNSLASDDLISNSNYGPFTKSINSDKYVQFAGYIYIVQFTGTTGWYFLSRFGQYK